MLATPQTRCGLVLSTLSFDTRMVKPAQEENAWESDTEPMDQEMQRYGLTQDDQELLTQSRETWRIAKGPERTKIGRETYIRILDDRPGLIDDPSKKGERTRKMLRDVTCFVIEHYSEADRHCRASDTGITSMAAQGNQEKNSILSKDGHIGWL